MARISQTTLAVLGALSVEPMTGYRLRSEITETLGHFWHESFGQIYPALSALEAAGMVARVQDSGTSGSLFRITAAGEQRLRELLAEPFQQLPARNPLLLRLFFGSYIDPGLIRQWLTAALSDAERACATYDELRTQIEQEPDFATQGRYRLMTVLAGRHSARARADWAREALALLEPLPGPEEG